MAVNTSNLTNLLLQLAQQRRQQGLEARQNKISKRGGIGGLTLGLGALLLTGNPALAAMAAGVGSQAGQVSAGGRLDPVALLQSGAGIGGELSRVQTQAAEAGVLEKLSGNRAAALTPDQAPGTGAIPGLGTPLPASANRNQVAELAALARKSPNPMATFAAGVQALRATTPIQTSTMDFDGVPLLTQTDPVSGRMNVLASGSKKEGDKRMWDLVSPDGKRVKSFLRTAPALSGLGSLGEGYYAVPAGSKLPTEESGGKAPTTKDVVKMVTVDGKQEVHKQTLQWEPEGKKWSVLADVPLSAAESAKAAGAGKIPAHMRIQPATEFSNSIRDVKNLEGVDDMLKLIGQGAPFQDVVKRLGTLDQKKVYDAYIQRIERRIAENIPDSEKQVGQTELAKAKAYRESLTQKEEQIKVARSAYDEVQLTLKGKDEKERKRVMALFEANLSKAGLTVDDLGVQGLSVAR